MLVLINFRIGEVVIFHDKIPGFRAGRGTGTASLEAKILQQLTGMI